MSDRTLPQRLEALPVDWTAAKQATKLAALTVVVLYALQMGVTAAVTSGDQPVSSVDTVPVDPQSSTWADAPETTVELSEQNMAIPMGGGSVDEATIRTVTNESHVAVRMGWTDPTYDATANSPENYSDAAAVMFGTGEVPPIMMGGVGNAVNIWYWRASWGHNTSGYGSGGMYAYPNDRAGGPTQPGKAVGNPISQRYEGDTAQNIYAEGYGSTSDAPTQPVEASAERTDDGWAVTFVRERQTGGNHDVTFSSDKDIYVAFAVWNGSAGERNGQKSITLQYRKLDLSSGDIVPIEDDGGDGSGNGSDGSSSAAGGTNIGGWLGILVASVLLVWFVSYYRMR